MNKKNNNSNSSKIGDRKLKSIIQKLYEIEMGEVFKSESLESFLENLGRENSTCKEFLICPLLTTISHLMGQSSILALRRLKENMVLYSVLIANPSTGKSSALGVVKNAILEMEEYINTKIEDSKLVNAATVEGLISHLKNMPCVISLWDEASTLMSSFGLYKGGDGKSYDRSIILELFNAPKIYKRDLTNSRIYIQNPRLNLSILGHPSQFIEAVENEKNSKDDGLIHRFNICCPEPVFLNSDEIENTPELECSLKVLFYIIFQLNKDPIQYKLDKEANKLFKSIYDKFKHYSQVFHLDDPFMGAMLGKCASQVLRIAALVHILKLAYNLLINNFKKFNLDPHNLNTRLDKFLVSFTKTQKEIIENEKKKQNDKDKTDAIEEQKGMDYIKTSSVKSSFELVSYFVKNKLAMAEYDVWDFKADVFEIFDYILKNQDQDQKFTTNFKQLTKQILMYKNKNNPSIKCSIDNINKYYRNLKAKVISDHFNEMEKLGFGKVVYEPTINGKLNTYFIRLSSMEVINNVQVYDLFSKFDLDVDLYLKKVKEEEVGERTLSKSTNFELNKENISSSHSKKVSLRNKHLEQDEFEIIDADFTTQSNRDKKKEEEVVERNLSKSTNFELDKENISSSHSKKVSPRNQHLEQDEFDNVDADFTTQRLRDEKVSTPVKLIRKRVLTNSGVNQAASNEKIIDRGMIQDLNEVESFDNYLVQVNEEINFSSQTSISKKKPDDQISQKNVKKRKFSILPSERVTRSSKKKRLQGVHNDLNSTKSSNFSNNADQINENEYLDPNYI